MKQSLLIICLLAFAATMQAQAFDYWSDGPDTSTTTIIYNTGGAEYPRAFDYDVRVFVDITGSESATVIVWLKPYGGDTFFPVKIWTAITADGYYTYSGYALGGTLRVSALSTDTGSAAITSEVSLTRSVKSGRRPDYWSSGPDTSTNAAVAVDGGGSNDFAFYYDLCAYVDVVSDTASLLIDFQPYGSSTWFPYDTVSSIMSDAYYVYQGYSIGGKLRARIDSLSPTGGSTGMTVWAVYAKKED